MNFVKRLLKSNEFHIILVIFDHLNKYGYYSLVKYYLTSKYIVHIFIHNIIYLHGILNLITNNQTL